MPGQIVEGPCSSSSTNKCYIIASKSSDCPHIVQHNKSGQFTCDSSCPMWQSSKICVHCIAAAEFAHCLFCGTRSPNQSQTSINFQKLTCQKEQDEKEKSFQEKRNEVVPHVIPYHLHFIHLYPQPILLIIVNTYQVTVNVTNGILQLPVIYLCPGYLFH